MANRSISMRMAREILRLYFGLHLKKRQISRACKVAPSTVVDYVQRAEEAGISWPLPEELDDTALEAILTERTGSPRRPVARCLPWMKSILSFGKKASPCNCCGLSIKNDSRMGINIRSFASIISAGRRP